MLQFFLWYFPFWMTFLCAWWDRFVSGGTNSQVNKISGKSMCWPDGQVCFSLPTSPAQAGRISTLKCEDFFNACGLTNGCQGCYWRPGAGGFPGFFPLKIVEKSILSKSSLIHHQVLLVFTQKLEILRTVLNVNFLVNETSFWMFTTSAICLARSWGALQGRFCFYSSLTKLMLVKVGTCLPITWVGHGIHLHVPLNCIHLFRPLISTWIFRASIDHDQCWDGLKSIFGRVNCIVQTCIPLTISSHWLLYLTSCKMWKLWLPKTNNS